MDFIVDQLGQQWPDGVAPAICEVGVLAGESLRYATAAFRSKLRVPKVWAIDRWDAVCAAQLERCGVPGPVEPYEYFRQQWAQSRAADVEVCALRSDWRSAHWRVPDRSVALVHLDAEHDCKSVLSQLTVFIPKAAPGGWVLVDDYDPTTHPGVVEAFEGLRRTPGLRWHVVHRQFCFQVP